MSSRDSLLAIGAESTAAADGGPSAALPPEEGTGRPVPDNRLPAAPRNLAPLGCRMRSCPFSGSGAGRVLRLCLARVPKKPPSKLRWAAHLAFLIDVDELVHAAERPEGAPLPEVSGPPCWREPTIRWSLAGIFHRLGFCPAGDRNEVRPVYCLSLPKGWVCVLLVYCILPGAGAFSIFLQLQGANHGSL